MYKLDQYKLWMDQNKLSLQQVQHLMMKLNHQKYE